MGVAFFRSGGPRSHLGPSNKKVRGPGPPAPGSDAYGVYNHKNASSWVRRQSRNTQTRMTLCPWTLWSQYTRLLNPKSLSFDRLSMTVSCAEFEVVLIRGFRFFVLTHPHTHIVKSDCNIRAAEPLLLGFGSVRVVPNVTVSVPFGSVRVFFL